jgi:hypothetical protein
VSANCTPPAFMRPPVSTCDLITVGAAISSAIRRACAAVVAKPCADTGMPALATILRDSYSKNLIGGPNPMGAVDAPAPVGRLAWELVVVRGTPPLLALAAALVVAAPASAVEITARAMPAEGVRLGNATTITGVATDGDVPLADRTVRLEVRKHPFKGSWKRLAAKVTDADGRYTFKRTFKRNQHVRVRLEGAPETDYTSQQPDTLSDRRNAYVLPAFTLSFKQRGPRRIRITQTYTVPKRVRLTAPTRFYVGPCKPDEQDECTARRAPFAAKAPTLRVRAGRYEAEATVRIPASFGGRFSYVSCFAYSDGSGMGDPDQRCPKKSVKLQRTATSARLAR